MQTVGFEPTRANTLRPERSTLDHSVIFACVENWKCGYIYVILVKDKGKATPKVSRVLFNRLSFEWNYIEQAVAMTILEHYAHMCHYMLIRTGTCVKQNEREWMREAFLI